VEVIRSRPGTKEFRENYDRVNWRDEALPGRQGPNHGRCRICGGPFTPTKPRGIGEVHAECILGLENARRVPRRSNVV
jgi:hypothetical protein